MQLINEHTKKFESVAVGDTLYTWEEMTPRNWERQKTWTFMCQGLLQTVNKHYILAPGGRLYELGVNCFTTADECRTVKQNMDRRKSKPAASPVRYKINFSEVTNEEQVKL